MSTKRRFSSPVRRSVALLILGVVTVGVVSNQVNALDIKPRQYGFSTDAVRKIGTLDGTLSKLCRVGQFNQRHIGEYYLAFGGKSREYIGIATQTYNLYDPTGRAIAGQTYHFLNDGTSQCRVYVAP